METANIVFADGPSTAPYMPAKARIRRLLTAYETAIQGASAGATIYDSKADMEADTSQDANAMAWVLGDATAANNGVYQFDGASTWTRLGDLPYSYISASNAGAGTADAIVATTSIPIPAADGAALIALPIVADNTGAATVAFNGGAELTIKTVSGIDVVVGGLKSGMIVAGYVSGSTFRLVSDQASAAIQAACEAAQAAAEAAAAGVNLPALETGDAHRQLYVKADESGYELISPALLDFGVFEPAGDGTTDDRAKLASADAIGRPILIGLNMNLRIASDITISNDIVFAGGTLVPDSGVTITLNGNIDAPLRQIFDGDGLIVFGPKVKETFPEWFGITGTGDEVAINACAEACETNLVPIRLTRSYFVQDEITVNRNRIFLSDPGSYLQSSGAAVGFHFTSENTYRGQRYVLPRMYNFSEAGLKIENSPGANIYCPGITGAMTVDTSTPPVSTAGDTSAGVLFSGRNGTVKVEVLTINLCGAAVNVDADDSEVVQGIDFQCNFVTGCKRAVLFSGGATGSPAWDGNTFNIKSIDLNIDGAVALQNTTAYTAPGETFVCDGWYGGIPSNGKHIDGKFNTLTWYVRNVAQFDNWDQWNLEDGSGCRLGTAFGQGQASGALTALTTSNGRADFNGGVPPTYRSIRVQIAVTAMNTGDVRNCYVWHPFALPGASIRIRPVTAPAMLIDTLATTSNKYEVWFRIRYLGSTSLTQTLEFILDFGNF